MNKALLLSNSQSALQNMSNFLIVPELQKFVNGQPFQESAQVANETEDDAEVLSSEANVDAVINLRM